MVVKHSEIKYLEVTLFWISNSCRGPSIPSAEGSAPPTPALYTLDSDWARQKGGGKCGFILKKYVQLLLKDRFPSGSLVQGHRQLQREEKNGGSFHFLPSEDSHVKKACFIYGQPLTLDVLTARCFLQRKPPEARGFPRLHHFLLRLPVMCSLFSVCLSPRYH